MAIVTRKPRNSSLRTQQYITYDDLSDKRPEKGLLAPLKRKGGRNAYGRITVRHRGGGAKKLYRIIDFSRSYKNVAGIVTAFEYDPNRNLPIILIQYKNGAKAYVLRPEGLNIGDEIIASEKAEAKIGNSLPLKNIPVGFFVHNVELTPGQGGKFARSAGTAAQLVAKTEEYATLKMPSGEIRRVPASGFATVGQVSNADWQNVRWGKAGRIRHRGFRPTVLGKSMNPVDHRHGGGEGHSPIGLPRPVTPWGKPALGVKTRKHNLVSDRLIVQRRPKKGKKR